MKNLQYVHGLAARGVHYLHRPGPILQDVGFYILPVCATPTSSFLAAFLYAFVGKFMKFIFELHADFIGSCDFISGTWKR